MGVKANISRLFALMKYILDNIDDGQISVMASFREKISYTFVFARLHNEIVHYDQIPLRYVQVIHFVDIFGNAFIELDSRHRPQHIKIGWLPLTITPYDALRRWIYSFLCILQERFHPYSLATLCTRSYDAERHTVLNTY